MCDGSGWRLFGDQGHVQKCKGCARCQPMEDCKMDNPPCAINWGNGVWMYFDEKGEQICELQGQGDKGEAEFRRRYPNATVRKGQWPKEKHNYIGHDRSDELTAAARMPRPWSDQFTVEYGSKLFSVFVDDIGPWPRTYVMKGGKDLFSVQAELTKSNARSYVEAFQHGAGKGIEKGKALRSDELSKLMTPDAQALLLEV